MSPIVSRSPLVTTRHTRVAVPKTGPSCDLNQTHSAVTAAVATRITHPDFSYSRKTARTLANPAAAKSAGPQRGHLNPKAAFKRAVLTTDSIAISTIPCTICTRTIDELRIGSV